MLAQEIHKICARYGILLALRYIRSRENIADGPTRKELQNDFNCVLESSTLNWRQFNDNADQCVFREILELLK